MFTRQKNTNKNERIVIRISEPILCYDRRSVDQYVLVSNTHLGPKNRFWLLSDICGFVNIRRPLWREDGSVVYNCCWSSPAQSFSDSSPAELVTIFYCLKFETLPTWRARSPYLYRPGIGWPRYPPRKWVPFSLPPATRRATVEFCKRVPVAVSIYPYSFDR
jgi:hypothetical protein